MRNQYDDYLDDDDGYLSYDEDEDDDDRWTPEWMHTDCASPCLALELGTCCMYPVSDLVRELSNVAGAAKDAAGGLDGYDDPGPCLDELARQAVRGAALLDTIPAGLDQLADTALFQLICPVGRLAGALAELCVYQVLNEADHPEAARRRVELTPVHRLAAGQENRLWDTIRARRAVRGADSSTGAPPSAPE